MSTFKFNAKTQAAFNSVMDATATLESAQLNDKEKFAAFITSLTAQFSASRVSHETVKEVNEVIKAGYEKAGKSDDALKQFRSRVWNAVREKGFVTLKKDGSKDAIQERYERKATKEYTAKKLASNVEKASEAVEKAEERLKARKTKAAQENARVALEAAKAELKKAETARQKANRTQAEKDADELTDEKFKVMQQNIAAFVESAVFVSKADVLAIVKMAELIVSDTE